MYKTKSQSCFPSLTESAHKRNRIYLFSSLVLLRAVRDLLRVVRVFTFSLLYSLYL
ncbi:hypothetical protein T11_7805 [Trichinella zimbabwensis]|uniref:Uncharacterized protein n=1 Tax=Trichinella zimbabwensis TaxID=268475 RepID=A0A0V1GCC9_9BILA|nr:hypothetical protein T11_7805 [Trichinella zimbabwensis]